MKKLILILTLLFGAASICPTAVFAQFAEYHASHQKYLQDRSYKAIVQYYNPRTRTEGTYELIVEVRYDRVVRINFGNGGYIQADHIGSDYYYNGGYLEQLIDHGQVVGVKTTVNTCPAINLSQKTYYTVYILY